MTLIPAEDHCGPPGNGWKGKLEPSLGPLEEYGLSSGEDMKGHMPCFQTSDLELSKMNLC